ncbi:MAG: CPBP family intramembrane metalloprotease [Planctomycetes bacterium]|nr:CPBP family intramembrane metalloprotease [Planctomycetota bacterium]
MPKKTKKKRAKGKDKSSVSQLFNFAQDSYLERTSRPVYAIVFLLPLIVFYEIVVIFSNTAVLERVPDLGAPVLVDTFVWVKRCLTSLGFGGKFSWGAPPLAIVVILIALQLASGKRWRVWLGDMGRMVVECVLLAVPLLVLVLFINSLGQPQGGVALFDGGSAGTQNQEIGEGPAGTVVRLSASAGESGAVTGWKYWLANIATAIGAGIYEELVFRLILICVLMLLFQDLFRLDHRNSIVLAVLISAALFSAHHHIDFFSGQVNPGDPFDWTRFSFRIMAGIYFAILFAIRGFGITAGTHAFYDIIATIINAVFFQQQ